MATPTDDLAAMSKAITREILSAPSLLLFLAYKQQKKLGSLPEVVRHPDTALVQSYAEEGITSHTGPPWSPQALETNISKVHHASACTLGMTTFIRGDMHRKIKDGFSILLPAAGAVRLFDKNLKLSCIAEVPQAYRRLRLILDLLAKLDVGMPSANNTTDREATPESLQFVRALPCILQAVWEADPAQGPVRVSKLYVTDAYHRRTIKPSQVGESEYVVPSAPGDKECIICIDLVLRMGWVDPPKLFCAFLETLTGVENSLVYTDLPVPSYGIISEIPSTGPVPPYTLESLTHIDCYMNDVISTVQGDLDHQPQVFDGTVRALWCLFPNYSES